jgi:hypothetical protein
VSICCTKVVISVSVVVVVVSAFCVLACVEALPEMAVLLLVSVEVEPVCAVDDVEPVALGRVTRMSEPVLPDWVVEDDEVVGVLELGDVLSEPEPLTLPEALPLAEPPIALELVEGVVLEDPVALLWLPEEVEEVEGVVLVEDEAFFS